MLWSLTPCSLFMHVNSLASYLLAFLIYYVPLEIPWSKGVTTYNDQLTFKTLLGLQL